MASSRTDDVSTPRRRKVDMRLPVGLIAEVDAALMEGESRTGFVVAAARRELAARGLESEMALTAKAPVGEVARQGARDAGAARAEAQAARLARQDRLNREKAGG